jgi:hypothetical protein
MCFPVISEKMATRTIPALLRNSRPSTVRWLVVPVAVYPVNRVRLRWFLSHILIKRRKVVQPAVTDSYATSTIIRIVYAIRIIATRFHSCPRSIFRQLSHAVLYSCFLLWGRIIVSHVVALIYSMIRETTGVNALAVSRYYNSEIKASIARCDNAI